MKRSSLLLAVRGLHYALVQIASLVLGAFFWFTLMTMAWRTLPPVTGDADASSVLAAAAPYLAAVAVHAATLWYVGGTAYLAQARTVIAVLAGSLLTYLAMSLFQAQYAMLGAYLAAPHLKAIGTTGLFFVPGWALVQWLRPAPSREPAREAIKVPITIACYLGAAACAVSFAISNNPAIAAAALVLVLGLAFLAVHWVYHGRLGLGADASRPRLRG